MKKLLFHIVTGISIMLFSCEKEANVKLPDFKKQLVVVSFISPQDTVISVCVSETIPVFRTIDHNSFEPEYKWIENATVTLSHGSNTYTLPFVHERGRYQIPADMVEIKGGETYFLNVSTPEGLKADSKCTVPLQNTTLTVTIDTIESNGGAQMWDLTIAWKDDLPERNFYRVFAEGEYYEPWDSTNRQTKFFSIEIKDGWKLISDTESSSGAFTKKNLEPYYVTYPQETDAKPKQVNGYLMSTDEPYFKYHKWREIDTDGNPFAEPSLPYTNINGGLGVFGSFNRTRVEAPF